MKFREFLKTLKVIVSNTNYPEDRENEEIIQKYKIVYLDLPDHLADSEGKSDPVHDLDAENNIYYKNSIINSFRRLSRQKKKGDILDCFSPNLFQEKKIDVRNKKECMVLVEPGHQIEPLVIDCEDISCGVNKSEDSFDDDCTYITDEEDILYSDGDENLIISHAKYLKSLIISLDRLIFPDNESLISRKGEVGFGGVSIGTSMSPTISDEFSENTTDESDSWIRFTERFPYIDDNDVQRLEILMFRKYKGIPQILRGHIWPSITQMYSILTTDLTEYDSLLVNNKSHRFTLYGKDKKPSYSSKSKSNDMSGWMKLFRTSSTKHRYNEHERPYQSFYYPSSYMHMSTGIYEYYLTRKSKYEKIISIDTNRIVNKELPNEKTVRQVMLNILKAYSVYDKEVGYCQGLSYIVFTLILNGLEELKAFYVLIRLMNLYQLRNLYNKNLSGLHLALFQLEKCIKAFIPDLYMYFKKQGILVSMFATSWFLTLFSYRFPKVLVFYLFDLFLLNGLPYLFNIALGILSTHKNTLMGLDFEGILLFFNLSMKDCYQCHTPDRGFADPPEFDDNIKILIDNIRKFKISYSTLKRLEELYKKDTTTNTKAGETDNKSIRLDVESRFMTSVFQPDISNLQIEMGENNPKTKSVYYLLNLRESLKEVSTILFININQNKALVNLLHYINKEYDREKRVNMLLKEQIEKLSLKVEYIDYVKVAYLENRIEHLKKEKDGLRLGLDLLAPIHIK